MKNVTLTFNPNGTYACSGLASRGTWLPLVLDGILQQPGCEQCPQFHSCRMSQWSLMETAIKDIPALRMACAEMGLELIENALARGYGKNTQEAPYVIRLRGPYDIAVLDPKKQGGGRRLVTDWWNPETYSENPEDCPVQREVGKGFGRLIQHYGVANATLEAKRRGHAVTRTTANGSIKLTISM
jgi:hypothetical protein